MFLEKEKKEKKEKPTRMISDWKCILCTNSKTELHLNSQADYGTSLSKLGFL